MEFQIKNWLRLEYGDVPIYVRADEPDWFVPNRAGDKILQKLQQNIFFNNDLSAFRFLNRLLDSPSSNYQGRAEYLRLQHLNEIWFHLSNRCNLTCAHCLFASSPKAQTGLACRQILDIADDAYRLGGRVFAITGGEPFIHPEIHGIIDGLLRYEASHVVVLTNGMSLPAIPGLATWDFDRFHLQISVDGLGERHDQIRGKGAFEKLKKNLGWLQSKNIPYTLSMCVTRENVTDMPALIDFAAGFGAGNVHFMWYFVRGRGDRAIFVSNEHIFPYLIHAAKRAEALGIRIDNIDALKTQIFAPRGTIHDGTTSAWESLAVGPDGQLYPSAALTGLPELATDLSQGLEYAWRNSAILKKIRSITARDLGSPFRFLLGGGDIDHSYIFHKTFIGNDPYEPLYRELALWLIAGEASGQPEEGSVPQLRLRMGEILESCGAHGKVALVHSNCLLAIVQKNSLDVVKSFYSDAAGDKRTDILNPVCYEEDLISHIPKEYRFRGYGCGSPIMDAGIKEGECILDLGCGSGVECFIASRLTGRSGYVIGIDMLDPMLALANQGLEGVSENLGYMNIEFKSGLLEALPLEDNSIDVVLSNCVMNLSVNKRRAYKEILRVLRPGGRMVISDVVCESEPDPAIRNDEVLRSECIAGALTQGHLIELLEETGFEAIRMIKRFPYRIVQNHPFFSLTYSAHKTSVSEDVVVISRGPSKALLLDNGIILLPGIPQRIPRYKAEMLGDQVFILDKSGNATNIDAQNTCVCLISPEDRGSMKPQPLYETETALPRLRSGCMVCGKPLMYFPEQRKCRCIYCHRTFYANSSCENGHFVCDVCHAEDGLKIIRHICAQTIETDMILLFEQIRQHPAIPINGPEYHALVPGVILASYRNLGGNISSATIQSGIERGSSVTGGYCAFMGVCGAAVGVGIAFSLILGADPLNPGLRKTVQGVTQAVLAGIAELKAARCCQRDSWIALKKAAELSEVYLPTALCADHPLICRQKEINKECFGKACPLF
jgi:MoaA/NifB/PqqE/SkfB family radical SAM enzyme/ubiquinone/menaquinone biosynthesis C-methylase UbiE